MWERNILEKFKVDLPEQLNYISDMCYKKSTLEN